MNKTSGVPFAGWVLLLLVLLGSCVRLTGRPAFRPPSADRPLVTNAPSSEKFFPPGFRPPRGANPHRWMNVYRIETEHYLPDLPVAQKRAIYHQVAPYLSLPDDDPHTRLRTLSILGNLDGLPEARHTLLAVFPTARSARERRRVLWGLAYHFSRKPNVEEKKVISTMLASTEALDRRMAVSVISRASLSEFLPQLQHLRRTSGSERERTDTQEAIQNVSQQAMVRK